MRGNLLVLAILVVTQAFAFSQTDTSAAKKSISQTAKHKNTITGCLTSTMVGKRKEYRLVDQKRNQNIAYSKTVDLGPYVGQSVTLVGDVSATPSADETTREPMPVFMVFEVQPASGKCK
jgi:hypothetical protein